MFYFISMGALWFGSEPIRQFFTDVFGVFESLASVKIVGVLPIRTSLSELECKDIYLGLVMYRSILMNMEVFQTLISNPLNSTLQIPKILLKIFVVPSSSQKS